MAQRDDDATPRMLTADEAARALRVCAATVHRAAARGELRSIKLGRSLRIPRDEIERLITAA